MVLAFERRRTKLSEREEAPGRFATMVEHIDQLLVRTGIPGVMP